MKWANLAPRFREHAHKLRQALASAVELHLAGKWGRPEIETAGLRDYARVFGHAISPRTFWRSFDRTLTRVGQGGDFRHLEHYLPAAPARRAPAPALAAAIAALPNLAQAIGSVANITQPTPEETVIIWDAACVEWQRLGAHGLTARQAQKRVLHALAASGLDLARNERALRINFIRKRERWIEGGYTPAALRDQRPESSGHRRELPLTADDGKLLLARSLHGGLAQAWRQARNAGILSAAATQAYLHQPASKSYVPHRVRDHLTPNLRMLDDIHHGPRQAALQGAYISRDWSDVSPGDWYSADDTTLPLYYWEENEQGRPHVLRGQCLVMNDCRTGRLLAFALHSERNYTAKVIRGLILKVHDTYGLPRRGFFFERGTWASAKLLKGAGDEVPGTETELGLREWVEFRHAQPGNARAKTVERIIGLGYPRV